MKRISFYYDSFYSETKGDDWMSNEIKMIYAEAEARLNAIETEVNALNPMAEESITGNVLELANKLNSLGKELENLLTTYQTLLLNNVHASKNSVQYMKEQDEKTSAANNTFVSE